MAVEPVNTPSAPAAIGPYSPAVRAGDWIVLSGQIPLDPATGTLIGGDIEAQTRQVMANVAAILGDCGVTWHDVAKATIFVTDLDDFPMINAVYGDTLGDHRPARATVQVAALPAGAGVEIEVWAYQPAR